MSYVPDIQMYIGGQWCVGHADSRQVVVNPATGETIASYSLADREDLQRAVEAAERGLLLWRATPAAERCRLLRVAAGLVRQRADTIAELLTTEQGKRFTEARLETLGAADVIDWLAEEGFRVHGRVLQPRATATLCTATQEPVGVVAAFTPWNFPINQAVRKLAAALATGCTVVLKGPEETPASVMALVRAFGDVGLPAGALNLVFGDPPEVSDFLIRHPSVRKLSFTGSTAVGKRLAALAGSCMKRVSMELGGHAPAIVCGDADIGLAVKLLAVQKFWNAGQACISPTRFLVHRSVHDSFVERLAAAAQALRVGDGMAKETRMGPLANARRLQACQGFVDDALGASARLVCGGSRIGTRGFFFAPTVFVDVPQHARLWNEEPFAPIVSIVPFDTASEAVAEANRLPYGLASYVFTRSAALGQQLAQQIEAGMVAVNSIQLGMPEMPFGGVKDSGYGSEGGAEALEPYLTTKTVVHALE